MKKKISFGNLLANFVLILLSLCCIIPIVMIVSISLSDESLINSMGYSILPRGFDTTAYEYIFENPKMLTDAYIVTIFTTIVGTVLSLVVMSMGAYPLARRSFLWKKGFNFYFYFTMLFSGGMVPLYILNTQYLKMGNTIWIYIFPALINVWYMFILRTFYKSIPEALIESAYIDGASEMKIYWSIMLPLSKPSLATIALFTLLGKWNDWNTSLLYITEDNLVTLQYLLQNILNNLQLLKENMLRMPASALESMETSVPSETLRMAMAVMAMGPMVFVFPFFQKYFVRGLTVGGVKG